MAARLRIAWGRTDRSQATTTRRTRSVTTLGRLPRPLIRPGGAAVDHFRFDHLAKALASHATRRASLGLVAAGLLGLTSITEDAAAGKRNKKRKQRKRKRKQRGGQAPIDEQCQVVGVTCVPGQSPRCCDGLQCDQTVANNVAGTFCCEPEGTTCTSGESCCSGSCDFLVGGGTCSPCRGRSCNATQPCCGGQICTNGYCGGCRDRAVACSADTDCCYSNCTSGACLSAQNGPCARDVDCRACYLGQNCNGACVNGSCAV